jgi:Spy/CpxP family protein refolding chaperone
MLTKHTILALGAAIILPVAALAMDQAGPDEHAEFGDRHGGEHDALMFLRGVQLTDTQRTQIHELMHDSFASHRTQMEQLHQLHKQIEDAIISTGAADKNAILALQKQASAIRDELDADRITTALQVRALLTPSQQAQIASVHQKMEDLHAQEHALMGDPRPDAAPESR